jgi:16S rRNA (guanine966-N2)-methyltransferase
MHIIGGFYRNRKLVAPKGSLTRPTAGSLRESLFNICQGYIQGARFLDLFAGSGAMGIEALSRGASHAVFIDSSREAIKCINKNLQTLEIENQSTVIYSSVFHQLERWSTESIAPFDIIYVDPPYNETLEKQGQMVGYTQRIIEMIDQSPLLVPSGLLFIEEAKEVAPPPESLSTLRLKNSRRLGRSMLYQYEKIS